MKKKDITATILMIIMSGVLALDVVSASAQSQIANLTPGQKYTLDCGTSDKFPLRESPTEGITIDTVKCGTPVTLLSKQDSWAYVRTNDQRIGYVSAWFLLRSDSSPSTPTMPFQPVSASAQSTDRRPTSGFFTAATVLSKCEEGLNPPSVPSAEALMDPSVLKSTLAAEERWDRFLGNCEGYMAAIIDLAMHLEAFGVQKAGFCLPPSTRLSTVAKTYVAYLKVHPEQSDYAAAGVVWLMLQERFPCQP